MAAPKDVKQVKRGDPLFSADKQLTASYMIQSGLANLIAKKDGIPIEIVKAGIGHIVGEEIMWGAKTYSTSCVAENDIKAKLIPLRQMLAQVEASSPVLKLFLRSLSEKQKQWWTELVTLKGKVDTIPCPPEFITKLFAVIYHTASYTGEWKKSGNLVVVWPSFKKYCQRIFLESPVRLENAVYILVNSGITELEMIPCETDPDAPDELGFVHFKDIEKVKRFYEFTIKLNEFPTLDPGEFKTIIEGIAEWNRLGKITPPIPEKEKKE
ncbi:MAG: Crp/Fnr family transcriptional regulator [Xanthomonadaceae bacterium]|nr:Crp/Fnr family transcriptional regulator [Xanthomonadaceae bacterium]